MARKPFDGRSWRVPALRGLILLALATALSAGVSSAALGATARLPAKTCNYFAPITFAISVNPGAGITSMDFNFTYDPAIVRARALYRTPLTTAYSLTYDVATPGVVTAHLSGGAALSGNGDVVWVVLDPLGGSGSSTALTWVSASFNAGGIPATTINGSLSLITPATLISVPTAMNGAPGANVPVFVHATAFTGGDSFDLDLEYDPAVVTATLVEKTTLTQGFTLAYNISTPGIIRIALFGVSMINGPGDLVKITFHVAAGPLGAQTPIDVTRGNINEGTVPTTPQAGLFTICPTGDGDGDSYSPCAGDCNDGNPSVHPGAVELCNGVDDDCDGTADGVVPAAVTGVALIPQDVTTLVTWNGVANASTYDIVRGRLLPLASSQGNFTIATELCLANNHVDVGVGDFPSPPTGDGFWYLVRASNCAGTGTYNSGALSQSGSRDAEIAASPNACP